MRSLVGGCLVLFFMACGPERGRFCDEFERAECRRAQRCGFTSAAVDCDEVTAAWDCSAFAPGARYDVDRAKACIEEREAAACDAPFLDRERNGWNELSTACHEVFVGDATAGNPCGTCVAGFACVRDAANCGSCQRWSTRVVGAGASCESTAAERVWCDANSECRGGTCVALAQKDAPCAGRCAGGYVCARATQGYTCQVAAEQGGECADVLSCSGGLHCVDGACELKRGYGAGCSSATECESGLCGDRTCRGPAMQGEACSTELPCQHGLTCERGANGFTCVVHRPVTCG